MTFDIATADDTATTADADYVARSLTGQAIPAGSTTYAFDVTVNGDAMPEPDEAFLVSVTLVVRHSHFGMLWARDVRDKVEHYLRQGNFRT